MCHYIRLSLFACVLLALVVPLESQAQFTDFRSEGTNYFTFARPGENTIQILLLGDTGRDGIYEIGEGTDLAEFIALAGGAGESPLGAGERRNITVRLLRPGEDGQRRVVYESGMSELLERRDYPTLESDDVLRVEVQSRRVFGWRDALSIVSGASTIILLVDRIIRISDR